MNKEFERYCTFLAEMMEKYGLLVMQDILEELSESSIRITGILREWDVIHMKECSK